MTIRYSKEYLSIPSLGMDIPDSSARASALFLMDTASSSG
jgi:hypothetical protein